MPSLQLLQLTEDGRNLLASRRKVLLLASGIVVAGGAAAYVESRFNSKKPDSYGHYNGVRDHRENSDEVLKMNNNVKGTSKKKGGLKSLQVLAAILLSEMGQIGARDLLALVGIVVLRTVLSNRLAKVQGFLFRAAFLRLVPSFFQLISENILLCFLLSTIHSTSKYITGTLSLRFRKILTKLIHAHYFENMAYYKISHVDGRIRNPEQRIASDVPRFCLELSELVQDDLTAVFDGLLYTWRLCSYASPKYIFWILGYVFGAGAAIRNFSPAFGKLMSKEQQLEGEYRQLHSRLRTHAESIAFYGGESREESHIQQKFKTLVRHLSVVLHDQWWFGMIQDFLLKYLGATVAVVLIIEPFFAGNLRLDASTLGRAEMLSNLRYHTSVVISLFQALGTLSISSRRLNRLSGYADRIHELMLISRELRADDKKPSLQRTARRNYLTEANYVEFSGVKVVTPTGNVLVKDLSLRVESGSNLLITGPNGSGKSSLFRVLGGLWPLVSGHIVKPGVGSDLNKEIFYVPQRPYTAVGTLRDQLIYPLTADQDVDPLTQSEMMELLKNVDLEYLLDRYPPEKEVNWGDELSLGEQQRLGMARLFYHKPKFAILDECTSAVTTDMEERFCAKVRAMGTSCITISHRPALVAFHDMVLSLDGEGGWKVHYKREDSSVESEGGIDLTKLSETDRQTDAIAVQRAFTAAKKDSAFSNPKTQSYVSVVIAASPSVNHDVKLPIVPQLQRDPRVLPLRVAAMFKVLVPTIFDKQGAQLLAVAFLVVSRTWVSDRIASLNGTTVKYVLEQDKAAFIRLIGKSVLQSAASSFIAPSLRFMHERLRTHAESIAFFGGGAREKAMVESRFRDLLDHSLLLLKKKWLFGILDDFVTKQLPHNVTWGLSLLYALEHRGDRALVSTQSELAHALRFLASVVSQSFLAFGDILELHRKFLELSGSINRIFELEELLDAAQSGDLSTDNLLRSQRTGLYTEDVISFAKVDIITPAQKLLARQLTCDVLPGKSLLVTGPNGSGKSSVFRVLRGLWPFVSGKLYKPSHYFDGEAVSGCGIFYVPQRPYTCLGTLRDQIIYPLSREEAELRELKLYRKGENSADTMNILDAHLKTILENVRLNYLLEREEGGWDANLNWEDILSLGEQQRLSMARLFFHKPKFAILDECTNATSVDVEEQLYRLAQDLGITVITSSQRPALIPFHALELRLVDGEGNWELRLIKQ
ncbi:ABC transporter D family member 1-like isoform X6 [Durio zibethinus]|uniref:ABC transporter D family member 1-like isoform X6 n=1 Tax=Durio zibethinus TaxID=66656 RepID=A0A6P6BCX7_DURZI|nr:ABC transporter D family member 1-like isoform X6 [Durio zibethinus]